ncbi:MAG: 23S rRNA (adenine(2503)-C(2))-methyltransferase RlmN [Firmicutes bacterium]|nr:23S rRNA (adenine(2503)-C(2))-methyltransferase RlmN [Bacillota bacterium]
MSDLKNMTVSEIEEFAISIGEKGFRGRQIFRWIHGQETDSASSFDAMTDLSKGLREKLESSDACISAMKILKVQESSDGTRKYLLGTEDGMAIETVFMKYKYGNSICVSSQAGCRMGCKFCASAQGGLQRNLTAGEIADQILTVRRDAGEKIGHVVVMGTGEPFDNYDELCRFLEIVSSREGMGLGLRNITVSTCGLIPEMKRFEQDWPQVNMAVSLHAPDNERRNKIMPVNKKYPLEELIRAAKEHGKVTGRRVTYEYALMDGFNDSVEDADALAKLLARSLCHVNLIPLNRVKESDYSQSGRRTAEAFCRRLEEKGVPATIRRELGSDIDAACGQLRASYSKL